MLLNHGPGHARPICQKIGNNGPGMDGLGPYLYSKSIDKAPAIKRENNRRHNARPCIKAKKPGRIAYKLSKNISIHKGISLENN